MKTWTGLAVAMAVLALGAGLSFLGAVAVMVVTAVVATHDTGGAPPGLPSVEAAVEQAPVGTGVSVNGRALTPSEIAGLTAQYGQAPVPGDYWYDGRSGLFGRMGEPPLGLLQAGHPFGAVSSDASGGHTHVTLNGRRLPAQELAFYESRVGRIRPGRYWADGAGNVGLEGLSTPLIQGGAAWNGQWSGRMSSGTVDRSGGGNSVYAVDGEVLTLP